MRPILSRTAPFRGSVGDWRREFCRTVHVLWTVLGTLALFRLDITSLRGENGLRFLPRTVPTTTTHPIVKQNGTKWPSEATYFPRVIGVHLVYEANCCDRRKRSSDPDDCNCSHLSGHAENILISSAILAMIYPIVEELFIYNNCDC